MSEANHLYAIGIGSNRCHGRFGRPAEVVAAAIARLDAEHMLFDASSIMINPASGTRGRDFANAVAVIESALEPPALLATLKEIEREFGRRPGKRWGDRILDLDILAWSGGRYRERGLNIPHSRLAERPFAIGLLAQIMPNWRLVGALSARHLAQRLAHRRRCR